MALVVLLAIQVSPLLALGLVGLIVVVVLLGMTLTKSNHAASPNKPRES